MFKVDIKEQMIYPGGYKEKVYQISFWLKDLKLCLCNGKSRNKEPMISRWAQGESLEELIRTSGGRLLSWSVEYHAFHSFSVDEMLFSNSSKYEDYIFLSITLNLIDIKKTLTSFRFPATSPSKLSQVFSRISTTRIVR